MQRIDQILPTIAYGDAVSNDTLALMYLLRNQGYESNIYAENISEKMSKVAKPVSKYKQGSSSEDVVIFHMSTGSVLSAKVKQMQNIRKIMIYHNITPEKYFQRYNLNEFKLVKAGREQLKQLNNTFDYCIADSEHNKQELIEYGYSNIDVLPILIPFEDYLKTPDQKIINKYSDGFHNIIFVGRIVPNKKQEDIIKSFYYYQKNIDRKSRLILVGSYDANGKYYNNLKNFVKQLKLDNVIFSGHIPFAEILAYYKVADVFLCMSEHEGFCVPLIESMFFEVPIIAFNSTAIPYTLGNSGILINQKNFSVIAEVIYKVIEDKELKSKLIKSQNERLKAFQPEVVSKQFLTIIERFLEIK